jgi:hypothetical protein
MLFAIIGGVIVGLLIAGSACLCFRASLTVLPKDLRRRWRAETASPRRP